ncbi:hypothetical protein BCR37DRAFT_379107 [Protomyces lactucae-debilis]|uniref:Uncharacterized protein n=1 Tax=Protomyces lactucae-debilis TaxID=2754530 RepID=A0A1Y2FGR2_PROLT|nr:uncharacterized protein BCR37DRAFT_379107 [Protomyces lactucae-debilis]ORY83138.1 hypothetical protein BCR37DRAFT_379107 [Protomyces lactucae-debilis]
MQLTHAAAVLALAASTSAAPLEQSNDKKQPKNTVPAWPPAVPNADCPIGWPKPIRPWDQAKFSYPGTCRPISIPVYKPGCITDTTRPDSPAGPGSPHPAGSPPRPGSPKHEGPGRPGSPKPHGKPRPDSPKHDGPGRPDSPKPDGPKPHPQSTSGPQPTSTKASVPSATPSTPTKYFNLLAPVSPLGSIFDGQLQANSPYPAVDVAAVPSKGPASVSTQFYLTDGALFDQYNGACEISSGNQLQCNSIVDASKAMKGFAIDPATMYLEFNMEDPFLAATLVLQTRLAKSSLLARIWTLPAHRLIHLTQTVMHIT